MTDAPTSPRSVPSQLGAQLRRDGDTIEAWVQVEPELCVHGVLRAAPLIMLADVAGGWLAETQAEQDWTFTVDIGLRRTMATTDRVVTTPVLQRAGRTMSIDLPMRDDTGGATATAVATFIRLPRRDGDPVRPDFPVDSVEIWHPAEAPLDELLDAHPTDRGMAVDLRGELLNPAGILQGGVAALLAELAAERVLEASRARLVTTSFDVRYVTMGRVGPIEAVVDQVGPRMAAVHLLDRGADDAVVTHNLIGLEPVP